MIEYAVETLDDIKKDILPLLNEHYKEVALYQDKIEFNPDWDRYHRMEEMEMLHIVTVRDDKKLVGYYISFLTPHIHYADNLYAVNDIVFILPEYRKAKIGLELFKFVESELKKLGVSVMTVHMKTKIPFDSLCEGLQFDYAERLYTKYIGE